MSHNVRLLRDPATRPPKLPLPQNKLLVWQRPARQEARGRTSVQDAAALQPARTQLENHGLGAERGALGGRIGHCMALGVKVINLF